MNTMFGFSQNFKTVNVPEFARILKTDSVQLLDVRTAGEFAEGTIAGARNVDVLQNDFLDKALPLLKKEQKVLVFCRSGRRSVAAANLLVKHGYEVVNLAGGYEAWISTPKE